MSQITLNICIPQRLVGSKNQIRRDSLAMIYNSKDKKSSAGTLWHSLSLHSNITNLQWQKKILVRKSIHNVKLVSNIDTKLKGRESNYLPRSFCSISELMHYLARKIRRKIVPD